LQLEHEKIRLISVYMPDGTYRDGKVAEVYDQVSKVIRDGRGSGHRIVIAGDMNVIVGKPVNGENGKVIGHYGYGRRNPRGQWLVGFAEQHQLSLANTMFRKQDDKLWTYEMNDRRCQLDYVLVDWRLRARVVDIEAGHAITTGVDHRALSGTLSCPSERGLSVRRMKRRRRRVRLVRWTPQEVDLYHEVLDVCLDGGECQAGPDRQSRDIEAAILEAAQQCGAEQASKTRDVSDDLGELQRLTRLRKEAREQSYLNAATSLSKRIHREARRVKRKLNRLRIRTILREHRGLAQIAGILRGERSHQVRCIKNSSGREHSEPQSMANCFAEFYEELYKRRGVIPTRPDVATNPVPLVTEHEVRIALGAMKNQKAKDGQGIAAEMLKFGSRRLLQSMAQVFTDVMQPGGVVPARWRVTTLKVLFKKGDPKSVGNYIPISILPILYKVFSKVLLNRLKPALEAAQCCDQAGLQAGYSCEDHLQAIVGLCEQALEWRHPLWIAAVDFKKAFDTVSHPSLIEALIEQHIDLHYVEVIWRLYQEQCGQVSMQQTSRQFPIERGTKQGDPISPVLFHVILEKGISALKTGWAAERYGFLVDKASGPKWLHNLRFADDILLVGKLLQRVRNMLLDLQREVAKLGLEMHPDKTKILHNGMDGQRQPRSVKVGGSVVEVLCSWDSTSYLGRQLCLTMLHDTARQQDRKGMGRVQCQSRSSLRQALAVETTFPSVWHSCDAHCAVWKWHLGHDG